ncbi:hypothetical protein [Streptomyces antimicrobicus]|uniref:DUF2637 domain-containing protein n=1 Tax=Streptomyces antimicrobicus TaxID=2883108 RepID=A0ABS8BA42_9ACTN|nr:hypothetical protein [Streptomyces antimicrobicus]MCB5181498.1 hypothetical protein [Streptomyces antimicrobicus]
MKKTLSLYADARTGVLAILGAVTLGVAVLSVAVNYGILESAFGGWAVPTVWALDALWLTFLGAEILAGNHRQRAQRVRIAGLALTVLIAALPTADLIMNRVQGGRFDLAVVLTPVAIVATKAAWWVVLPSLGRRTSPETRLRLHEQRQEVADRLEEMEADAAHRIELLRQATELERQVAEAETDYRASVLAVQRETTERLHRQAEATAQTVAEKPLPALVGAIPLPTLGQWTPTAPALPGTGGRDSRHGTAPQVSGPSGTPGETGSDTASHPEDQAVTLAELAAVSGVPVPRRGVALSDEQMDVVLRHLRYGDDPPLSYRQARAAFRRAGYVGGEERVRHAWAELMRKEGAEESDGDVSDEEPEDAAL